MPTARAALVVSLVDMRRASARAAPPAARRASDLPWGNPHDPALVAVLVAQDLDIHEAGPREPAAGGGSLRGAAELEHERAARPQPRRALPPHAPDDLEPARAARVRQLGLEDEGV